MELPQDTFKVQFLKTNDICYAQLMIITIKPSVIVYNYENHISSHKDSLKLQLLEFKLFADFFENEFRNTSSVRKANKQTN